MTSPPPPSSFIFIARSDSHMDTDPCLSSYCVCFLNYQTSKIPTLASSFTGMEAVKLFQFCHWHRQNKKGYNRLWLTWKCMRDISLQQTVTHMEVHEGHLSLPILNCWFLGGADCVPRPPAFTQFQPLERNTTTTMEHRHNYTWCFQLLEWNITTV